MGSKISRIHKHTHTHTRPDQKFQIDSIILIMFLAYGDEDQSESQQNNKKNIQRSWKGVNKHTHTHTDMVKREQYDVNTEAEQIYLFISGLSNAVVWIDSITFGMKSIHIINWLFILDENLNFEWIISHN